MPVCGSPAVLPQFAPPHAPGNWMCGRRWLDGVNTPSFAASRTSCFSFSCSSGLTNGFTSSGVIDCRANGGGLVGNRLRRRRELAGHFALRHRPLFDRPQRRAGLPLEHVEESGLARLRDDVDRLAVVLHRQQLRRGGVVVVPQIVMHDLEMPERLPVRASSASRQLPNRLSPWRSPP